MTTPKVWNKARGDAPRGAIYCGRGSPYGNPFKLGRDGDRDKVCDLFEERILPGLDVSPLRGKDLLCFCAPKRCHCDAILKKANAPVSVEHLDEYEIVTLGDHAVAHGEMLEVMQDMEAGSVDLILTDLPYGTTQNKWDSVIPLDAMWAAYKRVLRSGGVIVLTSQGPFTARLMLSNEKMFKYKWVWEKSKATNFLNSKKQPLRKHEDICVFYQGQSTYNPQMTEGDAYDKGIRKDSQIECYGKTRPFVNASEGGRYPTDVIYFKTAESEPGKTVWHPTQKPIDLMAYLIRTYSNAGDLILDSTMGSGTTGVAAVREGRRFRGIEMNRKYFDIAKDRIQAEVDASQ